VPLLDGSVKVSRRIGLWRELRKEGDRVVLTQVFWGVLIVVRVARVYCYLLRFLPVLGPSELHPDGPLCPT
jgi:hypothetical protein